MLKNKLKSLGYVEWATVVIVLAVVSLLAIASNTHKSSGTIHNAVGVNEQINYQGRLLTNTGAVVPDGTYNMEFKVYQDGDGVLGGGDETLEWTETRTGGNKVTVKNGYFSVYLGSITAFGGNIDWNQDTLWLSINIGGTGSPGWDGEMSPFSRFSSTPYALNSKTLNGLASGSFVQLAQGTQTDSSSTNASISINKTAGTANLLELLRGGSNVFTVSNSGATTLQNSTDSTSALQVKNVAGDTLLKVDTSTVENLLSNGQFETNTTGWAAKGSSTVSHTTSQKYVGTGAMQVANTAAANDGAKFNYALTSQTTYTITMYVKNSLNTASISTINIGRTEDGSTDSDCATGQTINGGGWTRLTCVFTTANVTGTNNIYIKQTDATSRTLYIDSVELQTGSNLITNPDVETNITDWSSYAGATVSHNTSQAYTGSASVQVDTSTSAASEGAVVNPVVQPNTTYTASFWVKTDAATSGNKTITMLKRLDSVDAGAGSSCGSVSVAPDVWTNLRCTFTIGSSKNTSPFLSVNATDDGVTPITYYVDTANLTITKYSSGDFGRISLNAALDSPLTVRSLQDSTTAFQVQQQNGNNILTVDTTNGFVGVGTATPTKTLQVDGKTIFRATNSDTDTFQVTNTATVGTANSVIFNVAGSSRSVSVGIASNTTNSTFSVYGSGLISTKQNTASAFRVQDASGITALSFATTSGNRKLQIGGTGTGNDGKLGIANGGGTSVLDVDSSGSGLVYISTDDFQVNSYSTSNPLITTDGANDRVGIGMYGPSYTLDVAGDINTSTGYRVGGVAGATSTCSGGQFLQNATVVGGIVTGGSCAAGGSGVTTVGTFSGSSIANGASISGSTITFGPADATNPGMVSTGTQTFAGAKTFTGLTTIKPTVDGQALEVRNSTNDLVFSVDTSTGNAFATLGATGLDSLFTVNDSAGNPALSVTSFGGSNTLGFTGDVAGFSATSGYNLLTLDGSSNAISFGGTGGDLTFNVSDTAGVSRLAIDTATGGNIAMLTDVFNLLDGVGGAFLLSTNGGNGRVAIGSDAQAAAYKLEVAGDVNVQSGSTYRINGLDINAAGTLTNVAYENQSNTFTSSNTFNNAIAANGGITFNNSTDTLGAFTNAGTQDAANNLIINIGNAGTDFTSGGGLTLAGTFLANGNSTFGDAATDGLTFTGEILGASPLTFEGATNNNIYTIFAITDPTTSNKTITFPDRSGTVSLSGDTFTGDVTGTLNSSGATGLTIAADAVTSAKIFNGTIVSADLSGTAGITNAQLANSSLTITAGNGLTTGGSVSLGGSVTLDIGAGNGITVNANDVTIDLTAATDGLSATTSSSSGLEVLSSGITLLQGCADTQVLQWNEASDVWQCASAGGSGVTTVGTFSGSSIANGASISGSTITFGPADGTNPGMVSTGTQTFAGAKTFTGNITGNGLATFQSTTASTGAFQVQNTSGLDVLNVNTATLPNLVYNPSFENGTNGWSKKGNASVAISSADETPTTFGSRELKIVTTANANDGATFNFTPTASTAYSITFWAKSTASTGANISFGHRENSGTGDVDCLTGQTLTTTWTQFTCSNYTTNATVNDTVPTVGIYVKQSDATSRTIYIDGVTMVQSTSVLNFDAGGTVLDLQALYNNVTINGTNNGELQPWQTNSNALNGGTGLRHSSATTSNGYIYNIGGCTGACGAGTAVTTVQYAKISSSGAVGAWNTTTALPAARYAHTSYQANGYIYVVGGDSAAGAFGATPQTTVYYAKVNNDGTIGAWQTNPRVLPAARAFHTSFFNGGFAYVIGGDNAGAQSTVYYAKIYADGSTGDWNTTTALTTGAAARRYASSVYANGYVYVMGGDTGGTAQTTIYYNSVNADGTLGASWASTTALPNARRYHTSILADGYIYLVGGDNGSAAQSTTYYAKLLSDGTVGNWNSNANMLPSARYGHAGVVMNGYIYTIGGYDGSNASASVFYGSTARTLIGGTLDLVGLNSQYLSDPGAAGAIVAGNIRAIGGLQVEGFADINGGLSVDSALNINAVSANTGQVIFNINNSSSNSIFNVVHMAPNFGSLASGGAFISNTSMHEEEWNAPKQTTAITADSVAIGDDLNWYFDTTSTTATYQTPADVVNGYARLTFGTTSGVGGLIGYGEVQNDLQRLILKANLPVIQMKLRTNINNATNDIFWGMSDQATAPTANDTKPANGIYFWNNNAAGGWQGVVRSGGADVGTVNCTGAISTTQFAVGRIQVESATSVRFLMDNDSSDGVNLVDCGVVSGANPTAAMGMMLYNVHTEATGSRSIDIDYIRLWQDDAPPESVEGNTNSGEENEILGEDAPLVAEPGSSPAEQVGIINFLTATSEDQLFNSDVYVRGTLYVDKIKANQIEGLELFTDQISKLAEQTTANTTSSGPSEPQSVQASQNISMQDINAQTIHLSADLFVAGKTSLGGGLTVVGNATFDGEALFNKLVTFVDKVLFQKDVTFAGRTSFNSDTGGYAKIAAGQTQVHVTFDDPYTQPPVVTVTVKNGQFVQYAYTDLTPQGFTIILSQPAATDVEFSWTALQIDGAKVASN